MERLEQIQELSELLEIPITEIVAHLQGGEYRWKITIDGTEIPLRAWQMLSQREFSSACVRRTLLVPKRQPRGEWDDIIRKFIAEAKKTNQKGDIV